jgi:hypothetical protein
VEYAPGGGPDKRCYRISCEKISRVLPGFRPQWTARKGAQELYDAYRAAGLTLDDMERGRYTRISHIQQLLKAGELDNSLHRKLPQSGNTFPMSVGDPTRPNANASQRT